MTTVKINSRRATSALDKLIGGISAAVDRGLQQTAFKGQALAVKRSKGTVAASIGVRQTQQGYELQARSPHAAYVEYGRKAIVARSGRFLRFVVAGRVVFARRVKAARARPFMRPAAQLMNNAHFVEMSLDKLVRSAR